MGSQLSPTLVRVASLDIDAHRRRVLQEVAEPVWKAIGRHRGQLHRVRWDIPCDATIAFTPEPAYRGSCPCLDLYALTLLDALAYAASVPAEQVTNSYAAMAVAEARNAVIDKGRQLRGDRGIQRPDSLATSATYRALETEQLRALLIDVVDEAGSDAPLESDEQLYDRLSVLRARRFGGQAARHRLDIEPDLLIVRRTTEQLAPRRNVNKGMPGTPPVYVSWWQDAVERPLGLRRRARDLRLDASIDGGGTGPSLDVADSVDVETDCLARICCQQSRLPGVMATDDEEEAIVGALLTAVTDRRSGVTPAAAVVRAVERLADAGVIDSEIARRFCADPDAQEAAAQASRQLSRRNRRTAVGRAG